MDLSSVAIHDVIHPTAAFPREDDETQLSSGPIDDAQEPKTPSWEESQLNPKNRIDSLAPLSAPLWRIDGCAGLGTQFYLVPLFIDSPPPMRIDAFIPEEAAQRPLLRQILGLDVVFHTRDATRVRRQGVTTHILRALQVWTRDIIGLDAMRSMYLSSPFGSRIVLETLALNVRDIRISLAPTYHLERQMLSIQKLVAMWNIDPKDLPPTVDISQLSIVEQLHDSVCLVQCHGGQPLRETGKAGQKWILKALTSSTKYLYHELRTLLTMEPHPHVIARPTLLVTKQCRFGGKVAVVGFVEQYHPGGSLRDILPPLRINGRLDVRDQLRWATQITSGLLHVRERGGTYYPDLRLDNIVLSEGSDAVIVDFEQRGVWCEFASPEVNALEYIRILASDSSDCSSSSSSSSAPEDVEIPEEVRARYARLLSRHLPEWELLQFKGEYTNPPAGYNVPWLCLSPAEQEASEVYSLGRALWCVFEGVSAPQRAAVWQSYRWEPDLDFPEYRATPPEVRALIDQCTRGRREALGTRVVRRGSRLVFREGAVPGAGSEAQVREIRRFARKWWTAEVKAAEDFLQMREDEMRRGTWSGNYYNRPTLREVLEALEAFRAKTRTAW
ncbi:Ribosomal protein S6 kinase alpha-5 [Pleurostoma richardsiae]|uniref:Ribosomal protein S6 kinase alpha-5 n=1 Tax=Pleurostoma richardsiae TaxID=41990 RepID=A0AA38VMP3_9PEZI|nr:Ribosomal protein S6 kinase alpha-5 [Pleurostoma richardsiae]